MKKIISLILCLSIVFCFASCKAKPEESIPQTTTEQQASPDKTQDANKRLVDLSVAMSITLYYLHDASQFDNSSTMWDTLGWYSAYSNNPSLTEAEITALQYIIKPGSVPFSLPDKMANEGTIRANYGENGLSYSFQSYAENFKNYFSDFEFDASFDGDSRVTVTIKDNAKDYSEAFTLTFDKAETKSGETLYSFAGFDMADYQPEAKIWNNVNFTFNDVVKANSLTNLISKFKTIKIDGAGPEYKGESYFFKKGNIICRANRNGSDDSEYYYNGFYGNAYFYKDEDTLIYNDTPINGIYNNQNPEDFTSDDCISCYLGNYGLSELEDIGNAYRFSSESFYDTEVHYYTIDKKTLAIKEYRSELEGSVYSYKFSYGTKVEDFGLFDGWDKELRTIEIVCIFHNENEEYEEIHKVLVPKNVEYIPQYEFPVNYYLDLDMTQEYSYPGNGEGYTIYVTDSMG